MKQFTRRILLLTVLTISCCPSDKWIVITTIAYPTPALKKLAQCTEWNMVVVADKKTPLDWDLPGCHFLSIEDQQALPYAIIPYLPYNHYVRKNIGYLYAIEHGAKIIYETDDDNILLNNNIVVLPQDATIAYFNTDKNLVNPYAYFGQPTVWPRGFPLSRILDQEPEYAPSYGKGSLLIQQGLANGDPDVDAIFRLTRGINFFFDPDQEPIALPHAVLCPYNSQNTLFHYDAFWALALPVTKTFRVCDIWRGYWTQRLLWDIGGNVCFLAPTVFQMRNEHNLLKDFEDELELYRCSENILDFIMTWQSLQKRLEERIIQLMQDLIAAQLCDSQEKDFMLAWIKDLHTIGYRFPLCKQ